MSETPDRQEAFERMQSRRPVFDDDALLEEEPEPDAEPEEPVEDNGPISIFGRPKVVDLDSLRRST